MAFKIIHDRANCIGCRACEVVAPAFWKVEADNKATLTGGKSTPDGKAELDADDKDYELNLNAAQSCPVNVIHLVKDGKQVI